MSQWSVIIPAVLLACSTTSHADDVGKWLATIAKVGPDGVGSRSARVAADQLSNQSVAVLPRLLEAMDTPNVVAANWYRTVFDDVVNRELEQAAPQLPLAVFRDFVRDAGRQGRLRRLSLSFLDRFEPGFRPSWLPMQLSDPEFRDEAVAIALSAAHKARQDEQPIAARKFFQDAFQSARREDQVRAAADGLKSLGVDVSIVKHMGFVTRWYLLGPFDAPGKSGFDLRFPPESAVDLRASYVGQDGNPIRWKRFETGDRLGQINLVQAIAPVKEAVGYAYTELISPRNQKVQLRCGADDNLIVWIGGRLVLAQRQWLNGTRLDRFTATVSLQKGINPILVKVCQGPQHKDPTVSNNWSLQLRFCDSTGAAVGLKPRTASDSAP